MKKKNCSVLLMVFTTLFTGLIISGCKKTQELKDPVEFYTKKLLKDTSFANFYFKVGMQLIKANKEGISEKLKKISSHPLSIQTNEFSSLPIRRNTDEDYTTESEMVYDYTATYLTNGVFFYAENPDFFDLTQEQQNQVLNNINDHLSDPTYYENNLDDPLVAYRYMLLNESGGGRSFDPNMKSTDPSIIIKSNSLTWGGIAGCITIAIGAIIYEYGGLIRDIYNAFAGTQTLMWGMVYKVAKSVVRNVVPWYKVLGTTVAFVGCLVTLA